MSEDTLDPAGRARRPRAPRVRGGDRRGVDAAGRRMHPREPRQAPHHLEECPACLRHYGVEERVKRLIATKCSGEKAPDSLRERLRIEISRTTIIRRG